MSVFGGQLLLFNIFQCSGRSRSSRFFCLRRLQLSDFKVKRHFFDVSLSLKRLRKRLNVIVIGLEKHDNWWSSSAELPQTSFLEPLERSLDVYKGHNLFVIKKVHGFVNLMSETCTVLRIMKNSSIKRGLDQMNVGGIGTRSSPQALSKDAIRTLAVQRQLASHAFSERI